jgi:hypothetical protein
MIFNSLCPLCALSSLCGEPQLSLHAFQTEPLPDNALICAESQSTFVLKLHQAILSRNAPPHTLNGGNITRWCGLISS